MRNLMCLAAALPLALVLGCSKGSQGGPVSGRITKDGQPLSGAQVVFRSVNAQGTPDPTRDAGGQTDSNGQYSLKRVQEQTEKVMPGEYRVEIHLIERTQQGIQDLIPPQYGSKSELKFTVPPEGSKDANFDVKSK